jgi:hypothetical protein
VRPQLKTVEVDGRTFPSGYPQYKQCTDEPGYFNGRWFVEGDEWTSGVLYPDHLGIAFTERLADLPGFVRQVERISGISIDSVRGVASVGLPGDPLLLGDWIFNGTFDSARLARRFQLELGGTWSILWTPRNARDPRLGYNVEIHRVSGP